MKKSFFSLSTLLIFAVLTLFMAKISFADSLFSQDDGYIELPLTEFYNTSSTYSLAIPITQSTQPGLEIENNISAIVWSNGETTPISTTFKVPHDYASGGEFRALCDESSAGPNKLDFSVYINKDGQTWDNLAIDQTPVKLTGSSAESGTPEVVTLRTTEIDTVRANDYVTLNVWRDSVAAGTGDIELYHLRFYYKKKAS